MNRFFKIYILPIIGYIYLRLLRVSISIKTVGGEYPMRYWARKENIIIVFWHGRQLMPPFAYKSKSSRPHILISMHADGEIISRIMGYFGFRTVRGSSSRRGVKALLEMISIGKNGGDLVVTPDGPRGPRYRLQAGVITMARKTGLPIVPLSFGSTRKKVFGSWDGFEMPLPFSRGVFVWGSPIYVKADNSAEYTDKIRQELEDALNEVTTISDSYYDTMNSRN